ncbi:hypothetical protein NDU88_007680 [Pleurodeles waltl]|uniref:Uncharacterized protein n=1 Tax=Pleurodeles waltl TaxID=8319 RepID=A0AAV7RQ50_PLEWA|nr:hypothetical protein NDU88_007680 [Pleurodeles waltl]
MACRTPDASHDTGSTLFSLLYRERRRVSGPDRHGWQLPLRPLGPRAQGDRFPSAGATGLVAPSKVSADQQFIKATQQQ